MRPMITLDATSLTETVGFEKFPWRMEGYDSSVAVQIETRAFADLGPTKHDHASFRMDTREFTDECERVSRGRAHAAASFNVLLADRHDDSSTSGAVRGNSSSKRSSRASTATYLLRDTAERGSATTTWIDASR
jgi:hypothetical protein